MKMSVCGSCGRSSYEYVEFSCPGSECKEKVVRCSKCKDAENTYQCNSCGFRGP